MNGLRLKGSNVRLVLRAARIRSKLSGGGPHHIPFSIASFIRSLWFFRMLIGESLGFAEFFATLSAALIVGSIAAMA